METLKQISEMLQKGKAKDVTELIQGALDAGVSAHDILEGALLDGMSIIGAKFKNNEVFVPEVLVAARAFNRAAALLKSRLVDEGVEPVGSVVIGTVKGDLHDIGKNLVKMMLEGAGFAVYDLGADVPEETFVEAVKEHKPDIVALSALLTTTMNEQENVVKALKTAGLRDKVKIMVGGAPVTQEFCDRIGADAYTSDAASAAEKAKEFVA